MAALFPQTPEPDKPGTCLSHGAFFKPQGCGQSGEHCWGCVAGRGCLSGSCLFTGTEAPVFLVLPSYPQWKDVLDSICAISGSYNSDLKSGLVRLLRLPTSASQRVPANCKDPYLPNHLLGAIDGWPACASHCGCLGTRHPMRLSEDISFSTRIVYLRLCTFIWERIFHITVFEFIMTSNTDYP